MRAASSARSRSRTWTRFAAIGVAVALAAWLAFVPWDLSSPAATSRFTWGVVGAVLALAATAAGVAYADRAAGQSFVVAAYLATLVFFTFRSIAAGDPLWVFGLVLVGVGAMAAFVTAFALGRLLRTGSTLD